MFSFLILFSISFDDQCVAPHISPAPVPDMTPYYVQVMLRHGARTPMNAYTPTTHRGYWLCDSDAAYAPRMHGTSFDRYRRFKHVLDPRLVEFLPNCRAGDLLLEGMAQHKRLGEFYHSYLYDTLKVFTSDPKTEELNVRCSDVERTLRSVQSFLHGFFPAPEPNTVIDVLTDSDELSLLRPNVEFCQEMKTDLEARNTDPTFLQYYEEAWTYLLNLSSALNMPKSISNLNLMCDWVITHFCDDKSMPSYVTHEIEKKCLSVVADFNYMTWGRNPYMYASYIFREVLRVANDAVAKKNQVKLTINSAHDSTISAVYRLLAGSKSRIPPYASHLLMEIWVDKSQEKWVRFALNGELIPLREMDNKTLVKYSDFLNSNYKKVYDHCKESP